MGESTQGEESGFKYTKYKRLDSVNLKQIKQITMHNADLMEVPKWIARECSNIRKLSLNNNSISTIGQE